MEIPDDHFLRSHPDTVPTLRKLYNLDNPDVLDSAITTLQDWLKKQHNFSKKDFPRPYLERLLILQKGSLQRAKAQMENICAMRTLLPEFFEVTDEDIDVEVFSGGILPNLTEDNYRVLAIKFLTKDIDSKKLFQIYKFGIYALEYGILKDYFSGIIISIDYSDVNIMDYIAAVNILELYRFIKIMTMGYALRMKQIHIITPSTAANSFINFVKKMFSSKIASRFYVHASTDALHKFLSRDVLPLDYGGHGMSLAESQREGLKLMRTEKVMNFVRGMSEAKSTEAYKMKDTVSDLDLGVSGSFRSLNVD